MGALQRPPPHPLPVFLRTLHLPAGYAPDVRLSQELVTKYLNPI